MTYVVDLASYEAHPENMRLNGFKILMKAGLRIPCPVKVITPYAFEEYRSAGRITSNLQESLTDNFNKIRRHNPDKGVAIRRAWYLPTYGRALGPRSPPVFSSEEVPRYVKRLFDAVVKNYREDLTEDAEVANIMHPFVHPNPPPLAGGRVFVSNSQFGNNRRAIVWSLFGNDEHSEYAGPYKRDSAIFDLDKKEIVRFYFGKKTEYVDLSKSSKSQRLPPEYRERPVLNLSQLRELLNLISQLDSVSSLVKSYTVEFSRLNDGFWFTEFASSSASIDSLENEVPEMFRMRM